MKLSKNPLCLALIAASLFTFSFFIPCYAQYSDLLDFNYNNPPKGEYPFSSLILSGNTLYGMTFGGGAHGNGDIFSVQIDGTGYTDLVDFNGSSAPMGANPYGSLILSGDTLYGTTSMGGAYGNGDIFSVQIDGTGYTDLVDFNGSSAPMGANPYGSLILSGDTLYGTTSMGGAYGNGDIFSVQIDGTGYTDLVDFNGSSVPMGANPFGSLILSEDTLYGMAYAGGLHGWGDIFSVQTNGTGYTDLVDFNDTIAPMGANPRGSLILSGNTLYGMTEFGGTHSYGVIFSVQTNGTTYRDLVNFNDTIIPMGANPWGSLILFGSTLYGMISIGGANGWGGIFSVQTNGTAYTNLVDFDYQNAPMGANPRGSLVLLGNTLYGMTYLGGVHDAGVIFSFKDSTLPNGINEITETNELRVFPNPTNGNLLIVLNNMKGASQLEIYNMLGKKIYTLFISGTENEIPINLISQPQGIYLYRLVSLTGEMVSNGKFIIQK